MRGGNDIKQLIGFVLFWVAVGMLLMLIVCSSFVGILIAAGFLLLGYSLYCGKM